MYEKLEYVDTYKMLIVKYDQNEQYEMDAASGSTSAAGGSGEVQARSGLRRAPARASSGLGSLPRSPSVTQHLSLSLSLVCVCVNVCMCSVCLCI